MTVGEARLLGPVEVRALAAELDLRPTKRLGQNFVHDANTVRRIVRAAELTPDDVVLEVGPGLGSLTLALLPEVAAVHAVEIDPVLAARLPATVAERAPGAGRPPASSTPPTPCACAAPPTSAGRRRRRWSRTCPTTSPCRSCCTCSPSCPGSGGGW